MPKTYLMLALASALACDAGVATAQASRRPIPDSIPDFGALVARLSDAGGYFDTDNLISNERGYQQVLGAMDRLHVRGGAYIGVGPDQNYTYIANTHPRIAFVVDIRRDNMLEHLLFKALFAAASNRAEYLALWTGRPVPANIASYASRPIDAIVAWIDSTPTTPASIARARRIVAELVQRSGIQLSAKDVATIARFHDAFIADGLSLQFTTDGRSPRPYYPTLRQLVLEHDASGRRRGYLATEADFQLIKSMHRRNLIVPVTGDLAGAHALAAIGGYLSEHGERVSVLYVSNVEDYLIRDGTFASYVGAVRALPRDSNAVIIRSYFGGGMGHPESTPEYFATQLLQRMDHFVADTGVAAVPRYRDLVVRDYVPLRKP
ncbi:MAG: hypothetical protein M3Z05_01465 [Gemmatimonadota bacterium]|nr:hypothetical protein [Gemmatimonadota bacterium]